MPEWPQPVRTTRPRPRTCATSAWSSRISGSGCQRAVAVGLVDGEALLELGRAVDLAGDQQRAVEQERGLLLLDDLEAGALERAAARGRQLDRLAARQRDPAAAPELGVDQDRQVRAPAARATSPSIPVVWSQWPWLSTMMSMSPRGELEPAHVLDQPVGRDSRVEQDPGRPAGLLDRHEAGEPVLGAQRVGRPAALEEARRNAGVGGERERRPLGRALVDEQQVGHVVDQRRDRQRVDRHERDRLHRPLPSRAFATSLSAARGRSPAAPPGHPGYPPWVSGQVPERVEIRPFHALHYARGPRAPGRRRVAAVRRHRRGSAPPAAAIAARTTSCT